jgi:hypothetical protein
MKKIITAILAVILVSPFPFTAIAEVQSVNAKQTLSAKQQSIVPIAAFTATGDMERLAEVFSNRAEKEQTDSMKISLRIGDRVLTATLIDSATTRDFISLLPLTLTLKDYAGIEKISDLPKRLSTKDVPSGSDPSIGDITYYAPWGNLAIFYRDFGYSSGLVILGKIDGGIEDLNVPGSIDVTIGLIK